MDKLPDSAPMRRVDDNELLTLAAFFETRFAVDWLMEMTGKKATEVLQVTEEAVETGWLKMTEPGIYHFVDARKQVLLRERLGQEESRRRHANIAGFLIKELPDDDSKARILAPHLLNAAIDMEGCRWLMKAADDYNRIFKTDEALRCYSKAIDCLEGLEGKEADDMFTAAVTAYSKLSTAGKDTRWMSTVLKKALHRAQARNEKASRVLLKIHLAKTEWLLSRYRVALNHFEQGWSMAQEMEDPRLLRSVDMFIPNFFYWQGRFREAVEVYEKTVSDVERYPKGTFPLISALMVGVCYAYVGQISQGMGMIDAIKNQLQERKNRHSAALAAAAMGNIMLDIRREEDAIRYLQQSIEEAHRTRNQWVLLMGTLMLARAFHLHGETERSVEYLRSFLRQRDQVQVMVQPYPYFMELCWAMESGQYPRIGKLSLLEEIQKIKKGRNIYMKGIACRFQALLQERENGAGCESMHRSLRTSIRHLEASGHQIELGKSLLQMTRCHLHRGERGKAEDAAGRASSILRPINPSLIPDELKFLIKERPLDQNLLKEILQLGQEMATIRESSEKGVDIGYKIISTVNRITGAERGALFLIQIEDKNISDLRIRASKNITPEQIRQTDFAASMKMIEDVAQTGKGRILRQGNGNSPEDLVEDKISSKICVPMILRDKVVGVLYHDNRLISSAFKESDQDILSYFAAQAAITLDNANAYEQINRLNKRLEQENRYYEEQQRPVRSRKIIGEGKVMKGLLSQVDQVAGSDTTVLILGETGVGKNMIAEAVHAGSSRAGKPLITVQCSALPESLITSELFGHEKGAFTGATGRHIGRFELADGGTLFLDEIGTLPLQVQVHLLKVLQSGEFERVGGTRTLKTDFRLVAATNVDLKKEVKYGRFRADLFYRISVFPLRVPPLRDRPEDIPLLANHFLRINADRRGKPFEKIPDEEMEKLLTYDWPGNVRELENVIERSVILSSASYFEIPELAASKKAPEESTRLCSLEENERRHIHRALEATGWKIYGPGGAGELLEIHPATLASRMKKLGITRPKILKKRKFSDSSNPL